jgi:hypothetical protein
MGARRAAVTAGLAAVAAAAALAAGAPAAAGDKVALKYIFRAGELQTYEFLQDTTTKTSMGLTAAGKAVSTTAMTMTYAVKSTRKDGAGAVEARMAKVDMDGEGLAGADLPAIAAGMKKIWFEMTVLPTGKFEDVKPHDVPAGMEAMVDSIEATMRGTVVFPDKPVGVGDKWKDEQEIPLPLGPAGKLSLKLLIGYSLRAFKPIDGRKHAIIDATMSMKSSGEGIGGMKLDATGDGSGAITFDVVRGVLVSAEMSSSMRMSMVMEGGTLTVDTETKGTTKLASVK